MITKTKVAMPRKVVAFFIITVMALASVGMISAQSANAKTVNYTPTITKIKSNHNKKNDMIKYIHVTWKKPNASYKNWNVQYNLKYTSLIRQGKTTGWKSANTLAKYQYFVKNVNLSTLPGFNAYCQIRFVKGSNTTKPSSWKCF